MNAQNLVKTLVLKGVAAGMLIGLPRMIYAADIVVPPAPCHPNPNAATDGDTVMNREDIKNLPDPLKIASGHSQNARISFTISIFWKFSCCLAD